MNLLVELSHVPNPDIAGGYWQDGNRHAPHTLASVSSLQEASAMVRSYIEENGLGAGNWHGGRVWHRIGKKRKHIATVSYNGRIWDTREKLL